MFRHILNFMRTGRPILPENFQYVDLLLEEAKYFELPGILIQSFILPENKDAIPFLELVSYLTNAQRKTQKKTSNGVTNHAPPPKLRENSESWEVVAVNISPEMGERIMISGSRETLEELFPEIAHTLQDARHSLAWNSSSKYVIRLVAGRTCILEKNFTWTVRNILNDFWFI